MSHLSSLGLGRGWRRARQPPFSKEQPESGHLGQPGVWALLRQLSTPPFARLMFKGKPSAKVEQT